MITHTNMMTNGHLKWVTNSIISKKSTSTKYLPNIYCTNNAMIWIIQIGFNSHVFLNWHSFPNHWKIGWNSQQQSHQFHWNLHCVFDSWFSIYSLSWNQSLILNVNSWHLFNQYILSTLKHSKTINCTPLQWKWLPFHIQWCAQYFSKVK